MEQQLSTSTCAVAEEDPLQTLADIASSQNSIPDSQQLDMFIDICRYDSMKNIKNERKKSARESRKKIVRDANKQSSSEKNVKNKNE